MKRIILIFLCSIGLSANAQVKTLTLKDAVVYALENKADAKKAKLQVENSEYKIQEIRSRALPQISGKRKFNLQSCNYKLLLLMEQDLVQPGTTIQATFGQKWTSGLPEFL